MYRSVFTFVLGVLLMPGLLRTAEAEEPVQPGMDAYYQWLLDNVDAIEKDLPEITEVATKAAERYVTGEWGIATAGDFGVMGEAVGRSGGIMAMKWGYPPKYLDREKTKNFIVLLALREGEYNDHLDTAKKKFSGPDTYLIAMGPEHLLQRARKDDMPVDTSFPVHAGPGGGLFGTEEDGYLVRTTTPASIAALWAWTAEFVAACTRADKMPVMHQSYAVEGAKERAEKMKGQRFESEAPDPIPTGQLGKRYLKRLRENLDRVYSNEKKTLRKAVKLAFRKRKAGGDLYTFLHGHAVAMKQLNGPHSPGFLTQLNKNWNHQKDDIELTSNDFVLCIGYASLFDGKKYQHWARKARESGATLVWSFTDYNEEDVKNVREAGELFINQHWDFGDAEVSVPGYPYDVFPTSGHIAQSVLRLFQAGLLDKVRDKSDGRKTNNPDENGDSGATE